MIDILHEKINDIDVERRGVILVDRAVGFLHFELLRIVTGNEKSMSAACRT
jgi:hypothetical protein